MRRIVYAVLVLGLFASFAGFAEAADLYLYRGHPRASHGGDCCGRPVPAVPRIRVVEQVPYCGDCDAPIAWGSSGTVRLRYVGNPVWERGCALGGCYGYYGVAPSCYWRDVSLPDGRGGRVRGVEQFCDSP
jgi:hypothetical protein